VNLLLSTHLPAAADLPAWVPREIEGDLLVVATLDGIPAGVASLVRGAAVARIGYYWVAPELRGMGIGQELIARATEEARARGAQSLEAWVLPGDRPAKLVFEALGFRTTRLIVRKELTA
jgi:GNAT superfamily N-acetyltransferase